MAVTAEQMKEFEAIESAEMSENGDVIRSRMDQILRDPYFQQTLDKESLKGYQDVADKRGHIDPNDTKNLSRFYKFMEGQWREIHRMKKQITDHVEQAIREKVITETDRAFYKDKMRENVVNGKQVVTKEVLEKAEKEVLESLDKRRDERKEYDQIANHKIVKESGALKTAENKSIEVPDEKGFLKLSVPERRVLLEKLKEALPKAEKYAETEGDVEAEKMTIDYKKALENAEKEGLIGKKTIEKYMETFKKVDNGEKEYWLKEMKNGNQLKRYEELWKNIRKAFQGTSLKRMESMKGKMGYSELLQEFGRMQEVESNIVTSEYSQKLKVMHEQGVISLHTMNAFMIDIKSQTLEGKKEYLKDFDAQMQRYKILRTKVNQIKDKGARQSLNEMYLSGEHGYKEIEAKYNRITGQSSFEGNDSQSEKEAEVIFDNMKSDTVRKEFQYANKALSYDQQKTFVEKMTHFLSGKREDNQGNYQKSIQSARREKEVIEKEREEGSAQVKKPAFRMFLKPKADDNLDVEDGEVNDGKENIAVESEESELKKSSVSIRNKVEIKTKTSKDEVFQSDSYKDKKGRTKRVIRTGGTKEAIEMFNQEGVLNSSEVDVHLFGKDGTVKKEAEISDMRKVVKALEKTLKDKRTGKHEKAA